MLPEILQQFFDIVDYLLFIHDERFRIRFANEAYCRKAGMTKAQITGKLYWDVYPPGHGPLSSCSNIAQTTNSQPENVTVGSTVYLSRCFMILDEQQQPLFLHVMRDITESEKEKLSEERYRQLFETTKNGILLLDATTGQVLDVNPYLTKMTGYSLQMLRDKPLWELACLKSIIKNKRQFLELRAKESVHYEHVTLESLQGVMLHVELTSDMYFVNDTKIIQCSIRDIGRRVAAEQRSQRLSQMYQTISYCGKALVRATDEMDLCSKMCQVLYEKGGFRMALVGYLLPDADEHPFVLLAAAGHVEGAIENLNLRARNKKSLLVTALRTGNVQVSASIYKDKPFSKLKNEVAPAKDDLMMAILPINLESETFGVLIVYDAHPDNFTKESILLLDELTRDLAFGINHLRAATKHIAVFEKLKTNLNNAVTAIAALVEMRDPYTAGHQRRVATLAAAIATELGLSKERIEGLKIASVVHDIGKIRVPAEILTNPNKLMEAEVEIIKTHPRVGWEVLKSIDFPWPVAEIVYQHHERLDGSGYPRGLKGDEILLETRILIVADVIEAMVSNRPYRVGVDLFAALQEISQQKGKLYDLAVVDACLRLFIEKKYKL
jgi:PAS domain S-box-containing protein/putative nucleotidyltransferase with HDIG domain